MQPWSVKYGEGRGLSIIQTSDGGFALAGGSKTFHPPVMIKIDENGFEEWRTSWENSDNDYVRCVIQTQDGGYLLSGVSRNNLTLFKLDSFGNGQWTKKFSKSIYEFSTVVESKDGGFVIGATIYSEDKQNYGFQLIKTNSNGDIEWTQKYGDNETGRVCTSIAETSDDGYVLAGFDYVDVYYCPNQSVIFKVDSNGKLMWTKRFQGNGFSLPYSIIQTSDGGYALAGATSFSSIDIKVGRLYPWVLKFDFEGEIQWEKCFDSIGGNFNSIIQTKDNGYALAGHSNFDCLIMKISESSDIVWSKKYLSGLYLDTGENFYSIAYDIIETDDGCLASIGRNFWFLKINQDDGELAFKPIFPDIPETYSKSTVETSYGIANFNHLNNTGIQGEIAYAEDSAWYTDYNQSINLLTASFGEKQPKYTGELQKDAKAFYGVKIVMNQAYNAYVTLSLSNPTFNSTDVLSYWNGQKWVIIENNFEDEIITAQISASTLNGALLMVSSVEPIFNSTNFDFMSLFPIERIIMIGGVFCILILVLVAYRYKNKK